MLLYLSALSGAYAPIAQLDRVTDYESVGRGFESLSAYQKRIIRILSLWEKDSDYFCFWQDNMDRVILCDFNIDAAMRMSSIQVQPDLHQLYES